MGYKAVPFRSSRYTKKENEEVSVLVFVEWST